MTRRHKTQAEKVENLLSSVEPSSRQRKVRKAVEDHFNDPVRNDGRGRKLKELSKVATTLRHIVAMPRWVADERRDLNFRRQLKDALKHIDHGQPWSKTVTECSAARGLINKDGQTRNERRESGLGKTTKLDAKHTNHPLNSVEKIRKAGRRGGNCLRDDSDGYLSDFLIGDAEFHEVRRQDVAVAWMRVDRATREVTHIFGPANEEATLPEKVLWALCRKLDLDGDEHKLFFANGMLTIFHRGSANRRRPALTVGKFHLWQHAGEVVMQDLRKGHWSRFRWQGSWQEIWPSHLDGRAFDAIRRIVPGVRHLARKAKRSRGKPKFGHGTCS